APPRGGGWRFVRRLMLAALVCVLALSLLLNMSLISGNQGGSSSGSSLTEKFYAGKSGARDKVAILHIQGAIMDAEGFIKEQIDRIESDNNVKAIVVRVDSPGGTVAASDCIYHQLKELRKE